MKSLHRRMTSDICAQLEDIKAERHGHSATINQSSEDASTVPAHQTVPLETWHILLLTVTLTSTICYSVEEDEPEVFLPPRNFNPHPYAAGYEPESRTTGNNGPVLFPETPPEPSSVKENPYVTDRSEAVVEHPYFNLAKKRKYKLAGRYQYQDNQLNSAVHKALAAHAAKVLRIPSSQPKDSYVRPGYAGEDYAFSYKVLDQQSGDDYSHTQSHSSRATKGEYRVKLPDGRVQIVSYIADKSGYNAEVKYAGESSANQYSQDKHNPSAEQNSIDYQQKYIYEYEPRASSAQSPTFIESYQDEYFEIKKADSGNVQSFVSATQKPYYNLAISHYQPLHVNEDLHIGNNNNEDKAINYVGSNVDPNISENYEGGLSSTIVPDLNPYSHVVVAPKYQYPTTQQFIFKK